MQLAEPNLPQHRFTTESTVCLSDKTHVDSRDVHVDKSKQFDDHQSNAGDGYPPQALGIHAIDRVSSPDIDI